MKQTTPASTKTVCDGCGCESPPHNIDCLLRVDQTLRDFQGGAVAGQSISRDLCNECASSVIAAMNAAVEKCNRSTPPEE